MKFYIETYGCQMNAADSELVTSILLQNGFTSTKAIDESDIIIFNTCSVRQHAEDRVLGRITNELKRKKAKPSLRIGVIGCMAQRIGDALIERNTGVDFAVGVDNYNQIHKVLSLSDKMCLRDLDNNQFYNDLYPRHETNTCGYVTIMRGCNNFCSYCIVPFVRGRERSGSVEQICEDVRIAAAAGVRDITLLGQNVNSYHWQGLSFPGLLRKLNSLAEIFRLRFITSHPKDLSDELIDAIACLDKVCEHIHLPMQSGDNDVLHKMNRNYTIEHYRNLITKLRAAIPDISITTDVIAGFPGETKPQFENTVQALKDFSFDYAFCFKYSDREGTAAAKFVDRTEESEKLYRLQTLIATQRQQTQKRYNSMIGKTCEVLVEGKSKMGGNQISGKTRDFKICVFDGKQEQIGRLVNVKIKDATAGTLIGEQI